MTSSSTRGGKPTVAPPRSSLLQTACGLATCSSASVVVASLATVSPLSPCLNMGPLGASPPIGRLASVTSVKVRGRLLRQPARRSTGDPPCSAMSGCVVVPCAIDGEVVGGVDDMAMTSVSASACIVCRAGSNRGDRPRDAKVSWLRSRRKLSISARSARSRRLFRQSNNRTMQASKAATAATAHGTCHCIKTLGPGWVGGGGVGGGRPGGSGDGYWRQHSRLFTACLQAGGAHSPAPAYFSWPGNHSVVITHASQGAWPPQNSGGTVALYTVMCIATQSRFSRHVREQVDHMSFAGDPWIVASSVSAIGPLYGSI